MLKVMDFQFLPKMWVKLLVKIKVKFQLINIVENFLTMLKNESQLLNASKRANQKLTLFRMGFFRAAHGWGRAKKAPPSINSVTHILQ